MCYTQTTPSLTSSPTPITTTILHPHYTHTTPKKHSYYTHTTPITTSFTAPILHPHYTNYYVIYLHPSLHLGKHHALHLALHSVLCIMHYTQPTPIPTPTSKSTTVPRTRYVIHPALHPNYTVYYILLNPSLRLHYHYNKS